MVGIGQLYEEKTSHASSSSVIRYLRSDLQNQPDSLTVIPHLKKNLKKAIPRTLSWLLQPPSLFNKQGGRGTVCGGGSLLEMTISPSPKIITGRKKIQRGSASLCISETWLPIPVLFCFFARLLLFRGRTFRGTSNLPTGHCIVNWHIRLLIKQLSIFWSVCPPPASYWATKKQNKTKKMSQINTTLLH